MATKKKKETCCCSKPVETFYILAPNRRDDSLEYLMIEERVIFGDSPEEVLDEFNSASDDYIKEFFDGDDALELIKISAEKVASLNKTYGLEE